MQQFHKFILSRNSTRFGQFVCPSSGVYSLYTQQWYMSYRFVESCRAGPGWNCSSILVLLYSCLQTCMTYTIAKCMYVYIGFKTFFCVVRHLDSIASYLPTGLHLGFFRSWPTLFLPSSFSSVFLVLSFVLASTSMLFSVVFLLPFFEHGHTM